MGMGFEMVWPAETASVHDIRESLPETNGCEAVETGPVIA